MSEAVRTEAVAIEDPPDIQASNPVHAAGGSAAYGYERPIVAGFSSYGWAAASVIGLLGEAWLDHGWADFVLRRPVFVGDRLETTATRSGDATSSFSQINEQGKVTTEGRAGLGEAPWHDEWKLPVRREPVPPARERPLLMPEQAPVDVDYPPMSLALSVDEARAWASERLGDEHPRYHQGEQPLAHPSWVPGQMTLLIRHSYRFAAGIHTTGRVQHLRAVRAPQHFILAGRWLDNVERKGKWWSTSDAVFIGEDGAEIAYCQQAQILFPPMHDADRD
ncbi:MAG: hypothetical protein HKP27_02425 [Myxococcales bacterium]|nr:hypothetical protein [Myxococcales bacterium]